MVFFQVKINEEKHNVYNRIGHSLKYNEAYIPKKDENGNWIQFPNKTNWIEVDLETEHLPDSITYDDILSSLKRQIEGDIEDFKEYDIDDYDGDLEEEELLEYLDNCLEKILGDIKI